MPFEPLGKSFLTGSIAAEPTFGEKNFRGTVPRFAPDTRQANQPITDIVRDLAAAKSVTPAQIALAWLLARKPWIVPIPGINKPYRLDENIGAAAIELAAEDLARICRSLASAEVLEA